MSVRLPPHVLDAEESILGAILLRASILNDLKGTLDPADFYSPAHATVYEAMLELQERGQAIDPITLKGHLGPDLDMSSLNVYMNATPSVTAFASYADQVIDASRRRQLIHFSSDVIEQCYRHGTDMDTILGHSDPAIHRLIAPRTTDIKDLYSAKQFMDSMKLTENDRPWLIPHILKPLWRVILVASEGVGKAVLMRFLAAHAAAGRDPWAPDEAIVPRRVLYIDVENSASSIIHQMYLANKNPRINLVEEAGDNFHIWHREGGMNLRDRRPQAELEAVLQKTRPEIVFAGPMYKLYRRNAREDMEQAALEFTQVLDDLRVRYGFALVLEHHAPKASGGGYREMNPFGSSLFLRWPEFGITMEPMGGTTMTDDRYDMELSRFRRDREIADWPDKISRGASHFIPWMPTWYDGRMRKLES